MTDCDWDDSLKCRRCGYQTDIPGLRRNCREWDTSQPSRGLGDTVAKMTSRIGIRPCIKCKDRQAWLNRVVPYRSPSVTDD